MYSKNVALFLDSDCSASGLGTALCSRRRRRRGNFLFEDILHPVRGSEVSRLTVWLCLLELLRWGRKAAFSFYFHFHLNVFIINSQY